MRFELLTFMQLSRLPTCLEAWQDFEHVRRRKAAFMVILVPSPIRKTVCIWCEGSVAVDSSFFQIQLVHPFLSAYPSSGSIQ